MRLTFERIWGVLPVPVLALDRMPGRLVGLSMGVFVVVRTDFAADRPTIVHELEHCKQFWRGGAIVHMLRYYASRRYRLRVEVEAFRAELDACGPDLFGPRLDDAARALSSGYHVGLDVHACRHLLTCLFSSDGSWPISPTGASLRSSSSPAVMGRSTDSIRR